MAYETIIEDGIDVLVVGAGLGGTGAAWEARFWGQDKKIVIAEMAHGKAAALMPTPGKLTASSRARSSWGSRSPAPSTSMAR